MKHHLKPLLIALATCLNAVCMGGEPLRWTRTPANPSPAAFTTYHGQTLELSCTFKGFGDLPFAGNGVNLYWQTNGMCSAWWSMPATVISNTVSASWLPRHDPGASRVIFFFGMQSNAYASAVVRFLPSPGFAPAVQPLPSVAFDAALMGTPTINGTNLVEYLSRMALEENDPTVPDWAKQPNPPVGTSGDGLSTNDVQNIVTNEVVEFTAWAYHCDVPEIQAALDAAELHPVFIPFDNGGFINGNGYWKIQDIPQVDGYETGTPMSDPTWESATTVEYLCAYRPREFEYVSIFATRSRTVRNSLGLARLSDLQDAGISAENATNIAVSVSSSLSNEVNKLKKSVDTYNTFVDGSNVAHVVTNYLSGAYSPDHAKYRILELRDGEYREVYNSRREALLHATNEAEKVKAEMSERFSQLESSVEESIAGKADRAWGRYTSSGGEAPSNTVYMTAPNTVFAGGMEYERVAVGLGTICVLTTKGAPVYTQGDEGTFKFQDDGGTNFFGFAKTDSYTIGCDTDGIDVDSSSRLVTLTYSIEMSGVPCIWYKRTLSDGAWSQLNLPDGSAALEAPVTVSWETAPDPGTEVCYINVADLSEGFFRATVEVAGSAKFISNMPADFTGGIICTDGITKIRPVAGSDGTITWEVME